VAKDVNALASPVNSTPWMAALSSTTQLLRGIVPVGPAHFCDFHWAPAGSGQLRRTGIPGSRVEILGLAKILSVVYPTEILKI
jgi:hypothetical protein